MRESEVLNAAAYQALNGTPEVYHAQVGDLEVCHHPDLVISSTAYTQPRTHIRTTQHAAEPSIGSYALVMRAIEPTERNQLHTLVAYYLCRQCGLRSPGHSCAQCTLSEHSHLMLPSS
jgi:hypothetical protein